MKSKLLIILVTAITNAYILRALESVETSESSLFIYGKITTVDNESYEGQIRWGKEEAMWFDFFNSEKPKNNNLKMLKDEELAALDGKDKVKVGKKKDTWYTKSNWYSTGGNNQLHVFACQFGDIKSIKMTRGEKVVVELKNGDLMTLEGGSNDIGATVQIYDKELGNLKMDWDRIEKVEFMETPNGLKSYYGAPLYGTVRTIHGDFTGYVQWDHDERLANDELNGEHEDGDMDIAFGNIKSIARTRDGSKVVLNSGREFVLTGTNDVNDENRGIIVNIPGQCRVDISWEEFNEVNFSPAPASSISYGDFKGDKKLKGKVELIGGKVLKGRIVYDLDEEYNLEMLNGMKEEIEYFIPFGNVKTITPKNREESLVELITGAKMLLAGKVDVNQQNDGLLVYSNDNDYTYVPWSEVGTITFE
jgi:hypothetical protein